MKKNLRRITGLVLGFLFLFSLTGNVLALEFQKADRKWSASLELGSTIHGSGAVRLVSAWWLPRALVMGENGAGTARLELDLGVLDDKDTTFDAGFQPVFRYTYKKYKVRPYIDLGAGIHFISRNTIRDREMGSSFQFSLLAGTGLSFNNKFDLGYRFFHLSNADIHPHNNGRDEHLLVLTFPF